MEQQRRGRGYRGRKKGVVLVVGEKRMDRGGRYTYLVYNQNLKDMYMTTTQEKEDGEWILMRELPRRPVSQVDSLRDKEERLDLGMVGGRQPRAHPPPLRLPSAQPTQLAGFHPALRVARHGHLRQLGIHGSRQDHLCLATCNLRCYDLPDNVQLAYLLQPTPLT
uniref:Uncharacterized protein n=1 Tax=Leersia perrieri TaxID=77586 RepID=A0A0D9VN13_9ORYZ